MCGKIGLSSFPNGTANNMATRMPTNENAARMTPWRRPRPAVDANKMKARIQMVMPHNKNICFKKHAKNEACATLIKFLR
jgi:hypothetical protein